MSWKSSTKINDYVVESRLHAIIHEHVIEHAAVPMFAKFKQTHSHFSRGNAYKKEYRGASNQVWTNKRRERGKSPLGCQGYDEGKGRHEVIRLDLILMTP